MRVNGRPLLNPNILLAQEEESGPDIFPFNAEFCDYFYSARYALSAAIEALQLLPHQSVLLPAYNCGVEIEPFIRHGLNVKWYRIKSDMTIDLDDLFNKLSENPSVLLIIHYLGFPQPLEEIYSVCKQKGIILIEDCAHAMLSKSSARPLGSIGDIAVFSLRKFLPIPEGGALVINNPVFRPKRVEKSRPKFFCTYYAISEMLRHGEVASNKLISKLYVINYCVAYSMRFILRIYSSIFKVMCDSLVYPFSDNFYDQAQSWCLSNVALKIIKTADYVVITEQRRQHFLYILEYIKNHKLNCGIIFQTLPDGVCPLIFPIIVNNRDYIYQRLKDENVDVYIWWSDFNSSVPWVDFKDSVFLKQNILGLPIHQDLTNDKLDIMLKKLKECLDDI